MCCLRYGLLIIGLFLLSGCQGIEHRSEALPKQPLPALSENKITPKLLWSNTESSGVGKSAGKLGLAVIQSDIVTADNKGRLFAFDRKTGDLKWKKVTGKNITAGPVVAQDQILIGTNNTRVLSLNVADGGTLWETGVPGSVLAAPQKHNEVVFVHSLDDTVTALNAKDGQELWRYQSHLPALMLRRSSTPQVVDGHVIVGLASGKLVSLNPFDGSPEWEREIAISKGRSDIQRMVDISADPVIKDNVIYVVTYQGQIAALALDSGNLIWQREMSSYSGLTLTKRSLFVADASGTVWALDPKSGDVMWKQTAFTGRALTTPAIFHNYVIVGDDEGNLHWLSQKDGAFIGRVIVDKKGIDATPVVKDDHIYVLGRSGKIAVYSQS